ncbi:MAG TPA: hypothetical protein PK156_21720 [Polyangium sp.]|nr:hypothetical protein [Polyangium sp.]
MKLGNILVMAGVGLTVAGCGISPGDYFIYRVSPGTTEEEDTCFYPDMGPPADKADDLTTIRKSETWIIYASVDNAFYLDNSQSTLEGVATDTGYQFRGKKVDIQFELPDGMGTKRTTTDTYTVDVTVDGDAISGKSTGKTTYGCNGPSCGTEPIPTCTRTTEFVGTHVDEIQLNYDL